MHNNAGCKLGQTYNPYPNAPLGQAPNLYANAPLHQYAQYAQQAQAGFAPTTTHIEPVSRFTITAERLQGQLANYAGFVDRLGRVADRLSGAVPEAVTNAQAKQSGNSVAAMLDGAQDDFDAVTARLNGILERLEAL